MPAGEPFAYAVLQVVPDLARGERLNVGVVLFCRRQSFLDLELHVDRARLAALAPALDLTRVCDHLDAVRRVVAGDPAGGPVAAQEPSERFGWVVAPSSTLVQPGPVHTGLTRDAAQTLGRLVERLVD